MASEHAKTLTEKPLQLIEGILDRHHDALIDTLNDRLGEARSAWRDYKEASSGVSLDDARRRLDRALFTGDNGDE